MAAALLAVSFGSFELATSLNNEAPYALLVTAIVGATLAWCDRPTWRWAVVLGILLITISASLLTIVFQKLGI